MARQWHCRIFDQELGPMTFAELRDLVHSGTLSADDPVRPAESATWQRAETVVGLFRSAGTVDVRGRVSEPPGSDLNSREPIQSAELVDDSTLSAPAGFRGAKSDSGGLGAVRIGPRTGLVVTILALGALFAGWSGWSSYAQSRRFPLPHAERLRQQGARYTFLGWGPLSGAEYALLWGDVIVVAGGVSWGLLRWARTADR